jgi:hypothetical protein
MDDNKTPKYHYEKGKGVIHHALIVEMERKGIRGAVSNRTHGSGPRVPDTTFKIVANGQTEEMIFTYEEIEDSAAQGIDSFANTKVRMLVSRFTGNPT